MTNPVTAPERAELDAALDAYEAAIVAFENERDASLDVQWEDHVSAARSRLVALYEKLEKENTENFSEWRRATMDHIKEVNALRQSNANVRAELSRLRESSLTPEEAADLHALVVTSRFSKSALGPKLRRISEARSAPGQSVGETGLTPEEAQVLINTIHSNALNFSFSAPNLYEKLRRLSGESR